MVEMKVHEIKIEQEYALEKLQGNKLFEVRKNDRDYQVGDLIKYKVAQNSDENRIPNYGLFHSNRIGDPFDIQKMIFQIMYITDYDQKDGNIVFSDWPVEINALTTNWIEGNK